MFLEQGAQASRDGVPGECWRGLRLGGPAGGSVCGKGSWDRLQPAVMPQVSEMATGRDCSLRPWGRGR